MRTSRAAGWRAGVVLLGSLLQLGLAVGPEAPESLDLTELAPGTVLETIESLRIPPHVSIARYQRGTVISDAEQIPAEPSCVVQFRMDSPNTRIIGKDRKLTLTEVRRSILDSDGIYRTELQTGTDSTIMTITCYSKDRPPSASDLRQAFGNHFRIHVAPGQGA